MNNSTPISTVEIGRVVLNNLETLRTELSITQAELAARVGVKRSSVGAWCEGRSMPPLAVLLVLAKMAGLSLESFLTVAHTRLLIS